MLDIRSGVSQLELLCSCVGLCHMLLKSKMEHRLRLKSGTTSERQIISIFAKNDTIKMYSVLVRIHQNFKAIIAALDQNSDRIINIFIIIDTPTFDLASEHI